MRSNLEITNADIERVIVDVHYVLPFNRQPGKPSYGTVDKDRVSLPRHLRIAMPIAGPYPMSGIWICVVGNGFRLTHPVRASLPFLLCF
ncbi:hypothetical protein Gxy13693_010_069 [Komagataeibacter xylinus NBRC 13693]|uniref:Uncharacterized protein n=1 Tax=Komagataeibacter xylinus NBRC 13693 TaxID=1234668 RepID=A0A0D6Q5E9_KOMXY|nr:hypothetical protein Gxy13693_010_069 [Komagataeibacter xylinus NBRC 13693]